MSTNLTDEEIRKVAKGRVGFKVHAAVYVIVNLFLAAIWFVTNWMGSVEEPDRWFYWPIFPHLGWGIGLAIHGFVAYGASADWERREEEKIRSRMPPQGGAVR